MSVIGRTPFIDKIVNNLDKSGVLSLASLLNNLGSATTVSLKSINDSNKGVSHVIFNLDELQNKNVEGILIYSDATHCGLFVFDTTSGNMYEYEIDPTNKTYIQIYEHLTVEELRQIVSDSLIEKGEAVSVQADDIDSGSATSGKVLTADGDGGASWESAGSNIEIGDVINLGQLDRSGTPVEFVKSLTEEEASAIPQQGLAIIMFNTTCIILPYVLGQWNRFVANCVYNDDGDSMVVRGRLDINTAESPYVAVVFDNEYSTAVQQLTESPYGVIRFIGL